jgi:hypothetical protein
MEIPGFPFCLTFPTLAAEDVSHPEIPMVTDPKRSSPLSIAVGPGKEQPGKTETV